MKRVALTGGIASGKSTALKFLKQAMGAAMAHFDADAKTQELLAKAEILAEIEAHLGVPPLPDGTLDRKVLRERVFGDESQRRLLEGILHPRIQKECLASVEAAEHLPEVSCFVADIPLLFESSFEYPVDESWVIACSRATQISRLQERSGFPTPLIEQILAAQLPMEEKVLRADRVLWNEGPPQLLQGQIQRLI